MSPIDWTQAYINIFIMAGIVAIVMAIIAIYTKKTR